MDECFVPDDHVLGAPGRGFETMMTTLNNDRLFIASRCVGLAGAALDLALPWVKSRKTFRRPRAATRPSRRQRLRRRGGADRPRCRARCRCGRTAGADRAEPGHRRRAWRAGGGRACGHGHGLDHREVRRIAGGRGDRHPVMPTDEAPDLAAVHADRREAGLGHHRGVARRVEAP